MKTKRIILSLIGLFIICMGIVLIVNQNTKKVVMQDGVMLALTLDGESITKLPTSLNYRVKIDCTNARGKVLPENGIWKFSVDNIKGNVTCNIDFFSRTNDDKLINIVKNASGIVDEGIAGYRYEGTNPNNYIWFNNEMWRIIGSIPTKELAGGTPTNLVKIIRKDSLGGISYDAKSSGFTGAWGSNTLYTLLNNNYYGKSDATNTAYCYGFYPGFQTKVKCDYRVIGISNNSTDYYGRMIKNVYWNTGASSNELTASAVYTNEKATQTIQGRIGLMSASDYGYAASSAYHSKKLSSYVANSLDMSLSNWLYSQGTEWTITQSTNNENKALHVYKGNIDFHDANKGSYFRPVVHLSADVYVISGSGTETDPYIIGM